MKHYCYKTIDTETGCYYIGKKSDIKNDKKNHFFGVYYGSGTIILRALHKSVKKGEDYIKHRFIKEIISYHDSSDEAYEAEAKLVTEKEVLDKKCYNLKKGGKGGKRRSVSVYQFTTDGRYITHFGSTVGAQESTGILKTLIVRCCRGRCNSSGGYIWRYKKDVEQIGDTFTTEFDSNHIGRHKCGHLLNKIVFQFKRDGTFVCKHASISEASNKTYTCASKIGSVCRGERKTSNNFIWRFEKDVTKTDTTYIIT